MILTLLETVEVPIVLQVPEKMTKVFDPWTLNRIKLTIRSTLWDRRMKRKIISSKVITR